MGAHVMYTASMWERAAVGEDCARLWLIVASAMEPDKLAACSVCCNEIELLKVFVCKQNQVYIKLKEIIN